MKILLDECVPWPIHRILMEHDCRSTQQSGWAGIKNGKLLGLAEGDFDLLITSDHNLRYQQNLKNRQIAIIELSTNKLRRIQAASALLQNVVNNIQPSDYVCL